MPENVGGYVGVLPTPISYPYKHPLQAAKEEHLKLRSDNAVCLLLAEFLYLCHKNMMMAYKKSIVSGEGCLIGTHNLEISPKKHSLICLANFSDNQIFLITE